MRSSYHQIFNWKHSGKHLNRLSLINQRYSTDTESNITFSNGRSLRITCGDMAQFANGTATVSIGESAVMVTAVSSKKPSSANFTPLTVNYRQRSSAAGRIPINFLRRELGPSEREILSARVVDRSIRPHFSPNFRYETQIICNTISYDSINLPDVQAVNGASAALAVSDIPWNGPVGAVRVGLCDSEIIINPTRRELQKSTLDLIVTATKQNYVVMLEGKGNNVLLQDVQHAIKKGAQEAQHIIRGIETLRKTFGKEKKPLEETLVPLSTEVEEAVNTLSTMRLREVFTNYTHDKISRDVAVSDVRQDVCSRVLSNFPDTDPASIQSCFDSCSKRVFRELIFEENRRCDGRALDELRNISCKVDLYKPLHGSALFKRGQTQVFVTAALDSLESSMKLDPLNAIDTGIKSKNFFLHYEFPPYATGEIGRIGPISRREIGHGTLAEKSLQATFPNEYPFTVRLTSEVLESNGSSSMATVCASSMALMDAGVPVSSATAGVAIGLVTKKPDNSSNELEIEDYRLLTDLLGIEDYLGDMDFKIAGTKKGITGLQADIKLPGVPLKIIMEALQAATDAKGQILELMNQCISLPRTVRKDCWPVTETLQVDPLQRAKFVGLGGINLKKLYLDIGVQITQKDENEFIIFAPSQTEMEEAKEFISKLLEKEKIPNLEFGAIYQAKITELKETGVMVTLYPDMQPTLLHNSQLDHRKIVHPSAIGLEVGQEIQVKYFGRDPVSGFIRLSRKVLQGPAVQAVRSLDRSSNALSQNVEIK